MRRPAHRTPAATAWAHPYTGPNALAVFYNDGGEPNEPTPTPAPPKPGPPPAAPPSFSQDDLDRIAAREKAQGQRAGARQALEDFAAEHGFKNVDDAKAFIAAARTAEEAKKTDDQKRQEELDRREQALADREAAALQRERTATRRTVLVGLGATGDDLDDATALLRVEDDADEQAITKAAEALKDRRPELFGAKTPDPQTSQLPPAPGGAPAGGPPARQSSSGKPGDRGREMARLRGHNRNAA